MNTNNISDFEKEFLKMRTSGYSVRDTAKKLRKSTNTVCRLNRKYFREIKDIKKAKLEELQKLVLEQKKERLDFFKTQLYLLNEKIYRSEIIMRYDNMLKLSIKLSDALNKCERDLMFDLITPDNNPITNVIGENDDNSIKNNEVAVDENKSDNKITKNKNSKSEIRNKSEKDLKNNSDTVVKVENIGKNEDISSDPPPRCKADFYRRVLQKKSLIKENSDLKPKSTKPPT